MKAEHAQPAQADREQAGARPGAARPVAYPLPGGAAAAGVLALQRGAGNRAVGALLARRSRPAAPRPVAPPRRRIARQGHDHDGADAPASPHVHVLGSGPVVAGTGTPPSTDDEQAEPIAMGSVAGGSGLVAGAGLTAPPTAVIAASGSVVSSGFAPLAQWPPIPSVGLTLSPWSWGQL